MCRGTCRRSGTGRGTLGVALDESGDPRGGPGRIRRHFQRSGTGQEKLRELRTGWGTLGRVRVESGTLGEVQYGSGTLEEVWDGLRNLGEV